MAYWLIYAIGFIAQLLFSGRMLVQWIVSEKNKKVLTPRLFWQLSILASFLMFIYGWLRDDFAIMLGQSLTYFIYIRNLHLQGDWKKLSLVFRIFLLLFPVLLIIYGYNNNTYDLYELFNNEQIPLELLFLGTGAQLIFTLRFVYQWVHSEKRKESILPMSFWILSIIGSTLILTYGIIRKDPVLIVGHLFGLIVYVRNVILLKEQKP